MMKWRWPMVLGLLLLLGGLLTSCRTGTTVHGQSCYELSEDDKTELIAIARYSLRRPGKQLTRQEVVAVQKNMPDVKIEYTGDCAGAAKIVWELPNKRATVVFEGVLDRPAKRKAVFEIIPTGEGVIYKNVPGKKDTIQK